MGRGCNGATLFTIVAAGGNRGRKAVRLRMCVPCSNCAHLIDPKTVGRNEKSKA
jgi:hypothetical protein